MTVDCDHSFRDSADGEDRRLGPVENGAECVDAVHAEIRDRESAAADILRTQCAGTRRLDELLPPRGDLAQLEPVSGMNDRHDQPVVDRDRNADVDLFRGDDSALVPLCVDVRMLA